MKYFVLIYLSLVCLSVNGQTFIPARNLQVTMNKTTNLIFPATISSVDRGSERIVVQKSTGNILRVKADTVFTDTTNLTVITTDGKLYSFLVGYASSPDFLNIDLGSSAFINMDTALYTLSVKVLAIKNNLHGIRYSSGKIKLSLIGLYTNGEQIACKLKLENASSFSFETGRLQCYANGTLKGKRRSSQQVEIETLLINPSDMIIKERQSVILCVILPKTALGRGQELQIYIQEKNGERQLSLSIPNKHLLRAINIR